MTNIAVSALMVGDLPAVAEIHAACFDDAWDTPVLRRILSMPGAFGLAARLRPAGPIVGFALARIIADECELLSLGVVPDRRGRGVGSTLLDAAMARAASFSASKFILEVAEDNGPARSLYAGRGMTQVGRRPKYYETRDGGFTDALTMRCDLSAGRAESANPAQRAGSV